jgi:hypothetical protein
MEFGPPPLWCFNGSIALIILGVGLGCPSLWLLLQAPSLGLCPVVSLVIAAGALVAGLAGLYRRSSMRYALTVHEQGMLVSQQGSTQGILYAQVQDFRLRQRLARRGARWGTLRTLDFSWPQGHCRIVHLDEASPEGDAFAAAIGLVQERLADAVQARIGLGGALAAGRWRLDAGGLCVEGKPPVPLESLNGSRLFEGRVTVRGQDGEPFFSVPEDSLNARLLGILVQRGLGGAAPSSESALGDLLFQRQMSLENRVRCFFLAGLCLVIILGLFLLVPMASWLKILPPVVLFGVVGVLATAASLNRFSVHERGVAVRSLRGSRRLRDSELSSFQYSWHTPTPTPVKRRRRSHPMRVGPSARLHLRFVPARGGMPIEYSQSVMGGDADMERLRDRVSSVIASQLLARLQRGEEVSWDSRVRFTASGLELQGLNPAQGEPRWVPYTEPLRISFDESTCRLFVGSEEPPTAVLQRSGPNFYPGLMLLHQLRTASP